MRSGMNRPRSAAWPLSRASRRLASGTWWWCCRSAQARMSWARPFAKRGHTNPRPGRFKAARRRRARSLGGAVAKDRFKPAATSTKPIFAGCGRPGLIHPEMPASERGPCRPGRSSEGRARLPVSALFESSRARVADGLAVSSSAPAPTAHKRCLPCPTKTSSHRDATLHRPQQRLPRAPRQIHREVVKKMRFDTIAVHGLYSSRTPSRTTRARSSSRSS